MAPDDEDLDDELEDDYDDEDRDGPQTEVTIEVTGDYATFCERGALVAQQRSYKTLERLCSAVADRLLADFAAEEVWVKATKPEPPIPLPVESVSVEVWRQAQE